MSRLSRDEFLALDDASREEFVTQTVKQIGEKNIEFLLQIVEPNSKSLQTFVASVQGGLNKSGGYRKTRKLRTKRRTQKRNITKNRK